MLAKDVHNIPIMICNINQARKPLQRHNICLTDPDHDYIHDKILHRDNIYYKININVED